MFIDLPITTLFSNCQTKMNVPVRLPLLYFIISFSYSMAY